MKAPKNKHPQPHTHLSILVSQDGLSFCFKEEISETNPTSDEKIKVYNTSFDKPLSPEEILEKIRFFIKEKIADMPQPEKVLVVFSNNLYSFVPEAYFDEKHLPDYLKFNVKILETDFIAHDDLEKGLKNVYVPYANINNYFFDVFGAFEYRHATSILVENLLKKNPSGKEKLYVHVGKSHFDLIAIEAEKLQLCNTFFYETPEDFLYYLLFTAQQLKWNPETLSLKFLGNISKDSKEYKLSYKYIRHCDFLENSKDFVLMNS